MTLSLGVTEMLAMTKFVLLYHGYAPPLPGRQAAWSVWFQQRAASFVEAGMFCFIPIRCKVRPNCH